MEVLCVDEISGNELPHEVEETGTAAELLHAVCRLFERDVHCMALEVDGAVIYVEGDGEGVSVGSLGVHSESGLVLRCSRQRAMAIVKQWKEQAVSKAVRTYDQLPRDGLPEWAWDDETVALALAGITKWRTSALWHVSDRLKSNREFALAAVREDGSSLMRLAPGMNNDKPIVLAAVREHGRVLSEVSRELRDDEEVVRAAIAQDDVAIYWASPYWKGELACWILPAHGYR